MRRNLSKLYVILMVTCMILLSACQAPSDEAQTSIANTDQFSNGEKQEELPTMIPQLADGEIQEALSNILSNSEDKQEIEEEPIESNGEKEPTEKTSRVDFELPKDAFIIEVSRDNNGDQRVITLKGETLQIWSNQTIACEKKIPIPAEVSIGNSFYEVVGNPYISEEGKLVLIQSYTTMEGELKLDYTILAKHCSKIVPVLAYDSWVFQNNEGKYGLAFYRDDAYYWYPYEGFRFNTVEDSNFSLPKPTIIWLNESTVKSANFGSWGSSRYGYRDISAISVRLNVESYGELDIANIIGSFDPIEIDEDFSAMFYESFMPQEYEERLAKVIQTLNQYKRKS